MAADRDEQQHQQQELEAIRRNFAEMGARMGSLFEPAEEDEPERATAPAPPPAPAVKRRPRWQLAAVAVLLLLLGTAFGWTLAQGDDSTPQAATATTTAQSADQPTTTTSKPEVRTVVSVPEECLDTAELADEVISRLNRNIRDERLFLALRDYTIASQACRRDASP